MRLMFLAAAAWATLSSGASAQAGGGLNMLMAMDANGDGAITRQEAEAARAALFDRVDADGDGFLSAQERAAAADAVGGTGRRRAGFDGADTDGDGRVSRAEAMGQPYRGFERLDRNHDNVVSAAEIEAVRGFLGSR